MTRYEPLPTSDPLSEHGSDNDDDDDLEEKDNASDAPCLGRDSHGISNEEVQPTNEPFSTTNQSDSPRPRTPMTRLEWVLLSSIFLVPWTAGCLVSWSAFLSINITDAPRPLIVNAVGSALEVCVICFILANSRFKQETKAVAQQAEIPRTKDKGASRIFSFFWIFLLVDPLIMGIYLYATLFMHSCAEGDSKTTQCGISRRHFSVIINVRVVVVYQLLAFFCKTFIWTVSKRERKEEEAAATGV